MMVFVLIDERVGVVVLEGAVLKHERARGCHRFGQYHHRLLDLR